MFCKTIKEFKFEDLNKELERVTGSIDRLLINAINRLYEKEFVVIYRYIRLLCLKKKDYLPEQQKTIFWGKIRDQLTLQSKLENDQDLFKVVTMDENYGVDLYIRIKRFMDSFSLKINESQAANFEGLISNVLCDTETIFLVEDYEEFVPTKIEDNIEKFLNDNLSEAEYWCALCLINNPDAIFKDKNAEVAKSVKEKMHNVNIVKKLYAQLRKK